MKNLLHKDTLRFCCLLLALLPTLTIAQKRAKSSADPLAALKTEAVAAVESRAVQAQQINDMLFSFSEQIGRAHV